MMDENIWDNFIAVCYACGTCGNAIMRLIEYSPEVYKRNPSGEPDHLGGMHHMLSRITFRTSITEWYKHRLNGFYDSTETPAAWVVENYPKELLQTPILRHEPPRPTLATLLQQQRVVIADHTRSAHARLFFPGAKIVAVVGDAQRAIRNFRLKWADQNSTPEDQQGCFEWIPRNIAEQASDPLSYKLDYMQLFSADSAADTYGNLCRYLEITPDWDHGLAFIHRYIASQPPDITT